MTRETRIADLLGEWFERQESGGPLDPEVLIQAHPDLADDLRAHFKLLEVAGGLGAAGAPQEDVPERLGGFRLEDELGAGGMGRVFRAVGADETPVAIKLVHPHLFRSPGFFKRFLREADLGRRVEHENVVRTLDVDAVEVDGRHHHFLVMEYVEGQTLRALLEELDRVPEELCRLIATEICGALSAIHAAGAVHRDLKPENVLITPDQHVKVMDLGVAQLQEEALKLSQTGVFVGSVHYAAPEQFTGGKDGIDARADLHGLGLLLYELAAGRHPYGEGDYAAVMRRILDEEPRRLGDLNPQLSPFFEEVVHRLLAKDPDARFASADELQAVLGEGEKSTWWHERAQAIRAVTQRPLRRIRVPRETAVYGRDAELALLKEKFEEAKAGNGQVLLIEGEAGIGKTRLVDEFVARLQREGEDLNFLFGSYPPGGAAASQGGISTALRGQLGDAGSAPYLGEASGLAPAFDAVLRGELPPTGSQPLTSEAIATFVVETVKALAGERPLVILIDDLHFAPHEALSIFASVAMAALDHRVLLMGTCRHELSERWLANMLRFDHIERHALTRLGPKDLAGLLREAFGSERLASELGWQIAQKSDGNPFFAMEIIQGLKEGQFLARRPDGTWATTQIIEDIQVPSSVADLVSARLGDLQEEERILLDVASVCGYEFDPLLTATAVGENRVRVLQRLASIEQRRRLVHSVGRRYAFDHHQVQELLYAGLPELLRQEYHALVAEALEARESNAGRVPQEIPGEACVELCRHYLLGSRGEQGLVYFERACIHLSALQLDAQMLSLLDLALSFDGLLQGEELVRALIQKQSACMNLGRIEAWREASDQTMRLVARGDVPLSLRERAERNLGILCTRTGDYAGAERHALRGLALARQAGDLDAQAAATINRGVTASNRGQVQRACELLEEGLALARECGNAQWEGNALVNLVGALTSGGELDAAIQRGEELIRVSEEREDHRFLGKALINTARAYCFSGQYHAASPLYERGLTSARRLGDRSSEALALQGLGEVLSRAGRVDDACECLDRALTLSRELRNPYFEATSLGAIACVLMFTGQFREASGILEEEIALSRNAGLGMVECTALGNLGQCWRALGRFGRYRDTSERALALSRTRNAATTIPSELLSAGTLRAECGYHDAGVSMIQEALELATQAGDRRIAAEALSELGRQHWNAGRPGDAVPRLAEALGSFRALGMEAEAIGVQMDLAEALASLGRHEDARVHLAEADRVATENDLVLKHTRCLALQGRLDSEVGKEVLAAHLAQEGNVVFYDRMQTRFWIWRATKEAAHLREARRLLDELVEHAPAEWRESMRTNVRLHREIMEAWEQHGNEPKEAVHDS